MQKVKISCLLIGVSDLKKARVFYENVLGMKFTEFRPPFASAELDGVEFNIEEDAPIREKSWAKNNIGTRKNVVFGVEDMNDFLRIAAQHGVKVIKGPDEMPWGYTEVVIADTDGNEFALEQKN